MMFVPLMAIVGGCATETTEDASPKTNRPVGNGQTEITNNEAITPLAGYHGLFDRSVTSCLEEGEGTWREQGSVEEKIEIELATSQSELKRLLGVNANASIGTAGFSAELGTNLTSSFNESSLKAYFVLTVQKSYVEKVMGTPTLKPEALAALDNGPAAFAGMCGAHYVQGVRYGAGVYVVVEATASSVEEAQDFKSNLKLGSGGATNLGSVDAQTDFSSSMEASDVSYEVHLIRKGYSDSVSLDPGMLMDQAALGKRIAEIVATMQASIGHDQTQEACTGCTITRKSVPLGVEYGFYDGLAEANAYGDVFDTIYGHWDTVSNSIELMDETYRRLRLAYNEANTFMGDTDRHTYQFYSALDGVEPAMHSADLLDTAQSWAHNFHPKRHDSMTRQVFDVLNTCWTKASSDVDYDCSSEDLGWVDAIETAQRALTSYQSGRILPLRHFVDGLWGVWFWEQTPEEACIDDDDPDGYRLPTKEEARLLSPVIAETHFDQTLPHAVWIDGADDDCETGSYYQVDPNSGEATFGCSTDPQVIENVVCVPQGGPFAGADPVL